MRRILFHIVICLVAGIVLAGFAPVVPPPLLVGMTLLILLLVGALSFVSWKRRRPFPIFLLAFLFVSAGFLYSHSYLAFHPNKLSDCYERDIRVTGIVEDTPVFLNGKWQYTIRVETLTPESGQQILLRDRIRITDSRKNGLAASYGDRLEVRGRLAEPSPQRNPGGYDDQQYLERQGIHARLSVRNPDQIQKIGTDTTLYGLTIAPLREHTWDVLYKLFPKGEAELAGGLVMGFASDLPEQWESAFEMLNVTHILAASGMNVGLIAGTLFYFTKQLRMPKRFANISVISTILIYTMLSGAGPSVVRASLMATLIIIGVSLARQVDVLTTVAIAALLSSLWNPGIISDIGFLLSFITTLGLFLITPRLMPFLQGPLWLGSAIAVTLAAQLSSLPILIYHFNQFSPFALLANLYIMPLTFLLVTIGFGLLIAGSIHPWAALPFVGFYRMLLWLLIKPIVWLADTTANWTWTIPSPPAWGVWMMYGCLLLALYRQQVWSIFLRIKPFLSSSFRRLVVGLIAMISVTLFVAWLWPTPVLRVTFLDVGQGDSALIETPGGNTILVDGGGVPSYLGSDFDTGEKIVVPFLRHRGVRTIDFMVATHADEDHVLGLLTIMDRIAVRNLIVSGYDDPSPVFQKLLRKAREKGIPIYESKAGIGWDVEPGVKWRFLHPGQIRTGTRSDTNANSVVFELNYGERSFLLTGDVEGEVEPDLLPYVRPVDVLKVAHHGSQHSTTDAFLERVRPHYAVISAGKRNMYHHPHKELLKRLERIGSKVFRTDQQGAITVITDGKKLEVHTAIRWIDAIREFR
ncbi:DNA internalization-related competence protein ComEC/Rec2 [Effusibacillus consociatus]|uniref:DNA internalization-related competence protein ComEC/Rec2 n=1 Tax=Effusibacillus consociatus TaxID=1117041 RepID=A0ABV9PXR5_9BACL